MLTFRMSLLCSPTILAKPNAFLGLFRTMFVICEFLNKYGHTGRLNFMSLSVNSVIFKFPNTKFKSDAPLNSQKSTDKDIC